MEDPGILLVDDDEVTLNLLERIFTAAGLKVHCTENGAKALEELGRRRYRLLVTDYRMPGMNGLELARQAREIVPDLQIVLTTAGVPPDIDSQAAVGISRTLAKPFIVGTIFNLARQMKETAAGEVDGDDHSSWTCPRCGTRHRGWIALKICFKCDEGKNPSSTRLKTQSDWT